MLFHKAMQIPTIPHAQSQTSRQIYRYTELTWPKHFLSMAVDIPTSVPEPVWPLLCNIIWQKKCARAWGDISKPVFQTTERSVLSVPFPQSTISQEIVNLHKLSEEMPDLKHGFFSWIGVGEKCLVFLFTPASVAFIQVNCNRPIYCRL